MAKQERAVRTRDTLIRSAAEVFDRDGISTASLTAISSRAGVSNGALHFHFASKAALVDVVEEVALTRLLAVTSSTLPLGASHVQLLVDVTHALADALRGDVVLRVGFALSGETSRARRVDLRERWRCWVEETLQQAEAEGELCRGPRSGTWVPPWWPRPWDSRCSGCGTRRGWRRRRWRGSGGCCCRRWYRQYVSPESRPEGPGFRRRWCDGAPVLRAVRRTGASPVGCPGEPYRNLGDVLRERLAAILC